MITAQNLARQMKSKPNSPKFQQCLNQLKVLSEIRLIQKLASPIQRAKKQQIYSNYYEIFLSLHSLLSELEEQYSSLNKKPNDKNNIKQYKKNSQKMIKQCKQFAQQIIQKYNELFINGSFKHFIKVAVFTKFPLKMHLISIQKWRDNILKGLMDQNGCC